MVSPLQAIIESILELSGSNCQRFNFYKISTSHDHSKNIFFLSIILTAQEQLAAVPPNHNILFSRQLMYHTSHILCKENSKMVLQTSRKL